MPRSTEPLSFFGQFAQQHLRAVQTQAPLLQPVLRQASRPPSAAEPSSAAELKVLAGVCADASSNSVDFNTSPAAARSLAPAGPTTSEAAAYTERAAAAHALMQLEPVSVKQRHVGDKRHADEHLETAEAEDCTTLQPVAAKAHQLAAQAPNVVHFQHSDAVSQTAEGQQAEPAPFPAAPDRQTSSPFLSANASSKVNQLIQAHHGNGRLDTPESNNMSCNSSPDQSAALASAVPLACTLLPKFTFKQLLNAMLQCTFPYVESEIGVASLDIFQHQVNKAFTPDYNAVVDPSDERWLSQIRTKLLNHCYTSSYQMLDDIGLIVKNAKRYHLNKNSQDRNLDFPPIAFSMLQSYKQACEDMQDLLQVVEARVAEEAKHKKGAITVQKTRRMIVEGLSKPDQPDVDFGPKHIQERNAVYRQRQKSALLCYVRQMVADPDQHAITAPSLSLTPECHQPVSPAVHIHPGSPRRSAKRRSSPEKMTQFRQDRKRRSIGPNNFGADAVGDACGLDTDGKADQDRFWPCPTIDEATLGRLSSYVREDCAFSEKELNVMTSNLIRCQSNPNDSDDVQLQLQDGPLHRLTSSFLQEWQNRRSSLMDNTGSDDCTTETARNSEQLAQERFNTPLACRGHVRTLRQLTQLKQAHRAEAGQLHINTAINESTEQDMTTPADQAEAAGSGTYESEQTATADQANAAVHASGSPSARRDAEDEDRPAAGSVDADRIVKKDATVTLRGDSESPSKRKPNPLRRHGVRSESSFKYLCAKLDIEHQVTSDELKALDLKLVDCEYLPSRRKFFLRLDDGHQHASFKTFYEEWQRRRAVMVYSTKVQQASQACKARGNAPEGVAVSSSLSALVQNVIETRSSPVHKDLLVSTMAETSAAAGLSPASAAQHEKETCDALGSSAKATEPHSLAESPLQGAQESPAAQMPSHAAATPTPAQHVTTPADMPTESSARLAVAPPALRLLCTEQLMGSVRSPPAAKKSLAPVAAAALGDLHDPPAVADADVVADAVIGASISEGQQATGSRQHPPHAAQSMQHDQLEFAAVLEAVRPHAYAIRGICDAFVQKEVEALPISSMQRQLTSANNKIVTAKLQVQQYGHMLELAKQGSFSTHFMQEAEEKYVSAGEQLQDCQQEQSEALAQLDNMQKGLDTFKGRLVECLKVSLFG